MSDPHAAAFFDFDRTVHDGDAGVLFARELLRVRRQRHRDLDPGTLLWFARNALFEAWIGRVVAEAALLRLGSTVGVVKRSAMLRKVYQMMKGLDHEDLSQLARDFVRDVLRERIFPQAKEEMLRHRADHRRVVIVSTGMRLLLEPARRHLPVDDVIAVDLVAPKGVLTGAVLGPLWGAEKAEAVSKYAHRRNLSLPWSYAYSDHRSDLPFLRLVGHPVAVNPDPGLRWSAMRRGWPVVAWRRPL